MSLNEIIEKLKTRTREETVEIAERYRFFKQQQRPDESVIDYMSELRKLVKTCNFLDYLNMVLCDQFVCGLRDSRIQRELLSVKDLMVTQALERCQAMEAASRETQNFQKPEASMPPMGTQQEESYTHLIS